MAVTKISSSRQFNVDDDLFMASKKITNLAAGTDAYDAVNKSQLDAVASGMAQGLLSPVQNLAALKAVSVSAGIDKYMIHVEDMGLFRYDAQSAATADDINVVAPNSGSGRWIKMSDKMNEHNSLSGLQGGTTTERFHLSSAERAAATRIANSSQSGLLSAADWNTFNSKQNSLGFNAFVDRETPSGAKNGSNTTFTLSSAPVSGSEHVYLNGVLQEPGTGNDYTISGNTITMAVAPQASDKLVVSYRR